MTTLHTHEYNNQITPFWRKNYSTSMHKVINLKSTIYGHRHEKLTFKKLCQTVENN